MNGNFITRLERSRNGRPRRFITLTPEQVEYAIKKLGERDAACDELGIRNALREYNQPALVGITGVAGEIAFGEICKKYGASFDPTTHVRSWHSGLDRSLDTSYKGHLIDVKSIIFGYKRKLLMNYKQGKTLPSGAWVALMMGDWRDPARPIFELVGFMLASELMVPERVNYALHSPAWQADMDELTFDIDPNPNPTTNTAQDEWEAQQIMMRIWFGEAA